jgi:hypothetical protein
MNLPLHHNKFELGIGDNSVFSLGSICHYQIDHDQVDLFICIFLQIKINKKLLK